MSICDRLRTPVTRAQRICLLTPIVMLVTICMYIVSLLYFKWYSYELWFWAYGMFIGTTEWRKKAEKKIDSLDPDVFIHTLSSLTPYSKSKPGKMCIRKWSKYRDLKGTIYKYFKFGILGSNYLWNLAQSRFWNDFGYAVYSWRKLMIELNVKKILNIPFSNFVPSLFNSNSWPKLAAVHINSSST